VYHSGHLRILQQKYLRHSGRTNTSTSDLITFRHLNNALWRKSMLVHKTMPGPLKQQEESKPFSSIGAVEGRATAHGHFSVVSTPDGCLRLGSDACQHACPWPWPPLLLPWPRLPTRTRLGEPLPLSPRAHHTAPSPHSALPPSFGRFTLVLY